MLKKFAKIIFEILIYAGIVIGIIWGVPVLLSKKLGTEYPIAAITSGSMWPTLKQNDVVFIKAIPKEELKKGDIIVWQSEKSFVIHRIVELSADTLTTKGDSNFTQDEPVPYSFVIGRTVMFRGKPFRIPLIGGISILGKKLNN